MKSGFIRNLFLLPLILILNLFSYPLQARIVRMVITKTEPYLDGKTFGSAGSYIRLTGQVYGEVDPLNPLNSIIQDIQLAPRNDEGMVEYISDFIILRPADMTRSNGLLFLSLPNRGNVFPADTVLLGRGYTYLWCAWQADVIQGGNRLIMRVPYAGENGNPIAGIVRTEYQVSVSTKTLNLGSGFFTGMTHRSYETVRLDNAGFTLTRRILESDPRDTIPKSD